MRIVNWNIEWMNNWFVGNNDVAWKNAHTGIADVKALAQRVTNVILDLDPDILTIEEGPSATQEMALFINDFLSANNEPLYEQFGGYDGGAQKIYALVKRNGSFQNARVVGDDLTAELFVEWLVDVDGDFHLEPYDFTRNPLVFEGELASSNETMRIIVLHTKSKFVNRQEAMWHDPARRQTFIVAALKNRRRISAEAMRTRQYIDDLMTADPNALIVVTGDMNDGPGVDFFERHYLTHGVADILLGSSYYPDKQFRHALIGRVPSAELFTAVFDDFIDEIDDRPILLDHILISPGLRDRISDARIAHQEFLNEEDTTRPKDNRDRFTSDHRPVVIDIQ